MVRNPPVLIHSLVSNVNLFTEPLYDGVTEVMQASKYSSFNRLLRVTAYILRFINNLKLIINRHSVLVPTDLQAEELTQAEQVWIRSVQKETFYNEVQFLNIPSASHYKSIWAIPR